MVAWESPGNGPFIGPSASNRTLMTARDPISPAVPGRRKPRKTAPSPKIADVKAIATEPAGVRLVVVKITTDQDGLYGYGCATFTTLAQQFGHWTIRSPVKAPTAQEHYEAILRDMLGMLDRHLDHGNPS